MVCFYSTRRRVVGDDYYMMYTTVRIHLYVHFVNIYRNKTIYH